MHKIKSKINQLLIFGFYVNNPPGDVGGIVLFERNINKRRKYFSRSKISQFVAIDQEGGRVNRIREGVTILPPAEDIKKIRTAYKYGTILAKELTSLGINIDFAPVVDVKCDNFRDLQIKKRHHIIGDRSFSSNPWHVAKLGAAMIRGMQNNGLIACAKHFPGHGPTKSDSHLCLPKVNLSLKKWKKIHLVPFVEAIKNNVKMIMVGHILYHCLDRKYPASLSHNVITIWLRNKLGYRGVIITDDLCMGAIKKHFKPGDAAVRAIEAGVDLLLVCSDKYAQSKVRNALYNAYRNGRISEKRIDESLERIFKLKSAIL